MAHGTHKNSDPNDISHELGHIVPPSMFLTVLIALLILTAITVAVSRVDFGAWNMVVAMVVASIKAGLVTLFFMHLKYESPVTWLYVLFPILLLFIMIGGVFSDNPMRFNTQPVAVEGQAAAPAEAPKPHTGH